MTDFKKIGDELGLPDNQKTNRLLADLSADDKKLSKAKFSTIRLALLEAASKPKLMKSWNPLLWLIPVGALAALVLLISAQTKTGGLLPTKAKPTRQLAVTERLGFGALPELTAQGNAAPEQTPSVKYQIPNSKSQIPISNAESSAAVGLAAPTATGDAPVEKTIAKSAPSSIRCLECGKYLPPRVVYKFTGALPEIPSEVAVYRLRKHDFSSETATALLQTLGLTGWEKISLQNLSFTESGDNPLTWTFDGNSNTLSFWRGGPYTIMAPMMESGQAQMMTQNSTPGSKPVKGRAATAFPEPLPKLQNKTLTDNEALKIAADFLKARGVAADQYSKPFVQSQADYPCMKNVCPMSAGTTAANRTPTTAPTPASGAMPQKEIIPSPIWWNPYVTVIYPALRDGQPILNWDASPVAGITLSINQQTREPDNGSVILPAPTENSLYPTQSIKEILNDALRGGLNPYYSDGGLYTPEEQKKRPTITITLESATIGYTEKYSDDGQTRYLLPVVGFRGTLQDQYGNLSDWGTIVPVVK